jgi:hypothetical protein
VTLALASGKSEAWIKRRTGHTSSSMIERYRRHAAELAEDVALAALDRAIPELATGEPSARSVSRRRRRDLRPRRRELLSRVFRECEGGDLNPHALSGASTSS